MGALNQHACFNELSFLDQEGDEDALSLFINYAKTIQALKEKGFNGIRYEYGITSLNKDGIRNIYELQSDPIGHTYFTFILSTARNPYIESDTSEEEKYINNNFEVKIDDSWDVGQGLISAYLLETIAISLSTHPKWRKQSYAIRNVKDEILKGKVVNVDTPKSLETDEINHFIEQHKPIELEKCIILPQKKLYKFRDDHGKDKLIFLWKKLRNCNYIVSAINSLAFNPTGREFVEKCFDDGKIHLRLIDSDEGFGMVIQTTGKTMRETIAIGEIIKQMYL